MTPKKLASILETTPEKVEELVRQLRWNYDAAGHGFELKSVAGGYRLCTRPQYDPYVAKLDLPRPSPLTPAALETLAIIAYRQPVTKSEIEAIRGVKVDSSIRTLLDRRLIQEVGRKDVPGRPILYGTSRQFLEYFGLDNLDELPPLREFVTEKTAGDKKRGKLEDVS